MSNGFFIKSQTESTPLFLAFELINQEKGIGGDSFSLDATTSVTQNYSGRLTSYPVEDGGEVSDHYVNNNASATFTGVISDANVFKSIVPDIFSIGLGGFSQGGDSQAAKAVNALKELQASGKPFTVIPNAEVGEMEDCTFQTLTITQSKRNGRVGARLGPNIVNSFRVSFTVKQTRFGTAATKSTLTKVKNPDKAADEKFSGSGGKLARITAACQKQAKGIATQLTKGGTTFADVSVTQFINACILDAQSEEL